MKNYILIIKEYLETNSKATIKEIIDYYKVDEIAKVCGYIFAINKIDLELIIDKDYAFLEERGEYKLVRKTRLSFFASFLMILLRKELLKENEVVSKEYLIDKIKIYIQTDDEKKVNKLINEAITKIIQLGFLKEINPNIYKIRESVERFIDVKTLQEFDNKFEEYIAYLKEKDAF
jgi:DNA-directed RNA polymerase subunit L